MVYAAVCCGSDRNPMAPAKKKVAKKISNSRKSDKRRGEIIRVAIEIINAKSYAQATMIDIAAALDLRDATLYHYFHDKRTLAFACHQSSLERAEKVLEAADKAGGKGAKKLHRFIQGLLLESEAYGALVYLGDYSYLDAPQRKIIRVWAERLRQIMVRFLNEGMADKSIIPCEADLVTELLLGMLIYLGRWVPTMEALTVDRLMKAIEAFSFTGIARRPPATLPIGNPERIPQ